MPIQKNVFPRTTNLCIPSPKGKGGSSVAPRLVWVHESSSLSPQMFLLLSDSPGLSSTPEQIPLMAEQVPGRLLRHPERAVLYTSACPALWLPPHAWRQKTFSPGCARLTASQLPAPGAPEGLENGFFFIFKKGFTAHEHQE